MSREGTGWAVGSTTKFRSSTVRVEGSCRPVPHRTTATVMDTTEIPKGTGVGKDLSAYLRVSCDSKDDTVLHSILRDPTCIRITRQVNDKENCEEVDVGVEVNVCAIVVV